jgi:glycosyltransferase involved in cell wall biosynthesis
MNRIAVLLSTYNGQRFLAGQLDSLRAQTHADWVLYWRDDGSSDASPTILRAFLGDLPPGRVVAFDDPGRYGATGSFLRLLSAAVRDGHETLAFADQDDVWLSDKLARGAAALRSVPAGVPALYFARQRVVDTELRPLGLSLPIRRPPGFPAALTQNLATGCTQMLNRVAAELVAASTAPAAANHDWWCYLVVAAAGGRLLYDPTPAVLYRQHAGNTIGAPAGFFWRAMAAWRRGPAAFTSVLRQHVAALADQPHLLAPSAREQVGVLAHALRGGMLDRVRALRMPGLRRQTWPETLVFRLWFMLA